MHRSREPTDIIKACENINILKTSIEEMEARAAPSAPPTTTGPSTTVGLADLLSYMKAHNEERAKERKQERLEELTRITSWRQSDVTQIELFYSGKVVRIETTIQ